MSTTIGPADVDQFRGALARQLGLALEGVGSATLAATLRRRVAAGTGSCAAYLSRLATDASRHEIGALAQELTVTETYFFRHIEQFRAFAGVVLPQRVRARAAERRLRLLSVGCASGEEPYTLAMSVRDFALEPSWLVSILGIDVNPAMIRSARLARYSEWALRATPAVMRQRWFRGDGRTVSLDEGIRQSVRFVESNLVDDDPGIWPPGAYDAIFCRNVLMYLTPAIGQALVIRMTGALAPGGFLFLGHADTLHGRSGDLGLRHSHEAFYYQRLEAPSGRAPAGPAAPPLGWPLPAAGVAGVASVDWADAIGAATGRIRTLTDGPRMPRRSAAPVAGSPAPTGWQPAMDLLRKERFGEALDVLETSPQDFRTRPDVLALHAALLVHSGRLDQAEEVCRRLLDVDGLNAGAHYLLGSCREGAGDWRGAVGHDHVAAYLDPAFAMPRLRLGLLARQHGDTDTARRELARALALLSHEDAGRLALFGGGFTRDALLALCRAELVACGGTP